MLIITEGYFVVCVIKCVSGSSIECWQFVSFTLDSDIRSAFYLGESYEGVQIKVCTLVSHWSSSCSQSITIMMKQHERYSNFEKVSQKLATACCAFKSNKRPPFQADKSFKDFLTTQMLSACLQCVQNLRHHKTLFSSSRQFRSGKSKQCLVNWAYRAVTSNGRALLCWSWWSNE